MAENKVIAVLPFGDGSDAARYMQSKVRDNLAAQLVREHDGKVVTDSRTIAREFGRRHGNVLRTLDSLIADGTIDQLNFESISYTDDLNREQRAIELDERGALIAMPFVGGRLARQGQARLVDAFLAMRKNLMSTTRPASAKPSHVTLAGELALAETAARLLCISESGRIAMMQHIAKAHDLDADLLPRYAIDAPMGSNTGSSEATGSATELLKENGSTMSAARLNAVLKRLGLIQQRTRATSQDRYPDGIKPYWVITSRGLMYGKNVVDAQSPRETKPQWFVSRFGDLLDIVRNADEGGA